MQYVDNKLRATGLAALLLALAGSATPTEQLPGVTIQGSRVTEAKSPVQHPGTPAVQTVSLTRTVSYADVDISTASGAKELNSRIADTAQALCDELDRMTFVRDSACVTRAVKKADKLAEQAVMAAEKARANAK